jgi:hypothetical protein
MGCQSTILLPFCRLLFVHVTPQALSRIAYHWAPVPIFNLMMSSPAKRHLISLLPTPLSPKLSPSTRAADHASSTSHLVCQSKDEEIQRKLRVSNKVRASSWVTRAYMPVKCLARVAKGRGRALMLSHTDSVKRRNSEEPLYD